MNNELKEILSNDNIHIIECDKNWCNAYGYEKSQLKEDLLDYITNLQYKYENQIDRYMNLKENTTNLQEENERLKELCDKYEEEHSNEFKIWKNERHQILDYKARCEKAIEFIKDEAGYDEEIRSCCCDLLYSDCDKLIELLGGDE